MTIPLQSHLNATPLNLGERVIPGAPIVNLDNGQNCVPQHYLEYAHTRESVESLLSDIQYSDHYIAFACEDGPEIYIQIGIIGHDNYRAIGPQGGQKIVFGRRWRVEPNLPSSEVIQTVFLAIKTAREHEIRELLRVTYDGKSTTPFSNHHDLPLMARHADLLIPNDGALNAKPEASLEAALACLSFAKGSFELSSVEHRRNGQYIIDIDYVSGLRSGDEVFLPPCLSLLCDDLRPNTVIRAVMDEVLRLSDQHVNETFTYKGLARFSRNIDVMAIANLSVATRKKPDAKAFSKSLISSNYDTDSSRVPSLYATAYGLKIKRRTKSMNVRNGIMPKEPVT